MNAETTSERKELLREFFLNATLIALIKELGRETTQLERVLEQYGFDDCSEFDEWAPQPAA